MSNCHGKELSEVYAAVFRDATYAFPTLEVEFERDLNRLLSLVERRGIHLYLVDLPAVGKHFDRCLAGGEYIPSGLPLTKRFSGGVVIPKFLRGLYLLVFHETGRLKDDYNVEAIFFIRQILFLMKKADFACDSSKIENEVLEFVEVDRSLPEPDGFWGSIETDPNQVRCYYEGFSKSQLYKGRVDSLGTSNCNQLSAFLTKFDSVSNFVSSALGSYDPRVWKFRHGPGAISERTGPSNKYSWEVWPDSLESMYPIADYGFHSFASWADSCHHSDMSGSREPASRMVAVPKSYTKPRLIAAEPCAHQWCQQNLWHYFCTRSNKTWIGKFVHFRDQTLNQELCLQGSRNGSLATIDLSAASDRVTCHAVGQFFRSNPNLLLYLRASRTHSVSQRLTPRAPELIPLRKFSTMGSACTFPIESLMFLGIAVASVLTVRGLAVTQRNIDSLSGEVAVFGDDIVIPEDSRELFVAALEVLHFKVNDSKSFWTGKFRESCGVDSFDGVNVTPVYWKSSYDGGPESLARCVETCNNFYNKFLLETSSYLASTLPRDIPEVAMRSGVLGLKTRTDLGLTELQARFNEALQRVEYRVTSLIGTNLRTPIENDSALLQFFTEDPSPHIMWEAGVAQRPILRKKKRWVSLGDLSAQEDLLEVELVLLRLKASAALREPEFNRKEELGYR